MTDQAEHEPQAVQDHAKWRGWMEARAYSTHPDDCEGMAEAFAAGMHAAGPRLTDDGAAEIARLRGALERYGRITTAWTRGMYSARIDCTRGDVKAAINCLSEGLDGYDGPEWDGTETGTEWWERTKAEEGQ